MAMDSFAKVNYGVKSSRFSITDDNLSMNLVDQRRKTIDDWILKRKEAWTYQEELLRSLTNKPTKDGHLLDDKMSKKANEMKAVHEELMEKVEAKERREDEYRMFVPRRVFLFNVDTFKDSQQVEGLENTLLGDPDHGVSTPEVDGFSVNVKPTDTKNREVQPSKRQAVFSRLKRLFGL